MLEYIYQWIENIAFYMVMLVAFMQLIPGKSYQKYIRFFAGMILILMLTAPIFKLFGKNQFHMSEYKKELEKITEATTYMEEIIGEE